MSSCTQIQDCSSCTSTPIPGSDGSQTCYWSSSAQKCGSFKDKGYGSTCDGYLDSLSKAGKAMKYAGSNIRTTDGTIAYVTNTGLVKGYTDEDVYGGTNGLHGCPANVVNVNATWTNLGYETGTTMVKGQSCGNETKYVTAAPPENDFNAQWYRTFYSDLKLETDQDALDDWTTSGQAAGRLPNDTILTSMASLGKVGYVDPNSVLHGITRFVHQGVKPFLKWSNVTGSNMADCTALSSVNYGDRVVLSANDKTAFLTSDSVLKFGSKRVVLLIRPLPGSTDMNGTPVKYGDKISLALSVTNYSSMCGYWGCKVGNIDPDTMLYTFGPGGTSGGTQLQITIPSSVSASVKTGDTMAYGAPFTVTSILPTPSNALFQGDKMTPGGERIPSSDGQYYLTYQTDGFVAFYQQPNTVIWKSEVGDANPQKLRLNNAGSLEAINSNGVTYWSTNTKGSSPFALAVQADGRLVLYDGAMKELWGRGTSNGASANATEKLYGIISSSNMKFTTTSTDQATFSFQTQEGKTPPDKCNVKAMRNQCGDDCVGFVHDPSGNEWQPIKVGATAADFKITTSVQNVYLKQPIATVGDVSCKDGPAEFINPSTYASYVVGDALTTDGTKQCAPVVRSLDDKQADYEKRRDDEWNDANRDASDFDNSPLNDWKVELDENNQKTTDKLRELKHNAKKLKKAPGNVTYAKQSQDSEIVERQSKMFATVWLHVAVILLVTVLSAWFGGPRLAVYGFVTMFVLYVGWRLT